MTRCAPHGRTTLSAQSTALLETVRRGRCPHRPADTRAPSDKPSVGGDAHAAKQVPLGCIAPYATAAPWHQASLCEGGGMAEGHAGGRDVTRNSLPQSASPTAPSQRGPRIRTSPPCKPSPAAKALLTGGPWPPPTFAASRQRRDLIIVQTPGGCFQRGRARTDRKPSERKIV